MTDGSALSRRAFIGSVTAAGVGALAPAAGGAQRAAGSSASRGLIDFHHHFDPPAAVTGRQGGGNQRWTAAGTVEEMEKAAVGVGMANLTASGTAPAGEAGRKWARSLNDWAARTAGDYRGRFGLFATLPMLDIDGALQEVEYAYETLKADGIGIGTSYEGLWLGDAKFKPLWSELHRRNAIVYVHPNDDQCCTTRTMTYESGNGLGSAWLEWPVNTARAIMSLMVNGVTREYSGVRFILSHGGGVAPLLIHRIAQFDGWTGMGPDKLRGYFPRGIEAEFRTLYFEGAQAFSPVNLEALMKLVPASHILFGTDYNRFPLTHSAKLLADLELPNVVRSGIERDNAIELFPRLA